MNCDDSLCHRIRLVGRRSSGGSELLNINFQGYIFVIFEASNWLARDTEHNQSAGFEFSPEQEILFDTDFYLFIRAT